MSDLLAQARAVADHPMLPIDQATGQPSTREFVGVLADEIERLRKVLAGMVVAFDPKLMNPVRGQRFAEQEQMLAEAYKTLGMDGPGRTGEPNVSERTDNP